MANFNLDDYITVNERIEKFYEKYPEGSIQTEIVSNENGQVIFKAYAYRDKEDTRPATGHAMEREGSTFINKTSHIENAETSAVGRALAMLGFEIKKAVCSREEVENARHMQEKIGEDEANALALMLKEYSEEDVKKSLARYKAKNIADLTRVQYADILQKLRK